MLNHCRSDSLKTNMVATAAYRQLLDINPVVFNYIRHAFDVHSDNFIGLPDPDIKTYYA